MHGPTSQIWLWTRCFFKNGCWSIWYSKSILISFLRAWPMLFIYFLLIYSCISYPAFYSLGLHKTSPFGLPGIWRSVSVNFQWTADKCVSSTCVSWWKGMQEAQRPTAYQRALERASCAVFFVAQLTGLCVWRVKVEDISDGRKIKQ